MNRYEIGSHFRAPHIALAGLVNQERAVTREITSEVPIEQLAGARFLQAYAQSEEFGKQYREAIRRTSFLSNATDYVNWLHGAFFEDIAFWYFTRLPKERHYTILPPEKTKLFYWAVNRSQVMRDVANREYQRGIYALC